MIAEWNLTQQDIEDAAKGRKPRGRARDPRHPTGRNEQPAPSLADLSKALGSPVTKSAADFWFGGGNDE